MKMLYILNKTNRVNNFSYSSMLAAKELSIEFHIAGNWTGYDNSEDKKADEKKHGITIHQIDFIRTPYDPRNIKAYRQVVKLIRKEKFDIIHCNTPIGGVIGRIAGKRCGVKQIIYQAHGFHFYKGAPKKNWIIYHTIEKFLAQFTDIIITMNNEDYDAARKFKLKQNGKVFNVHGVGINLNDYININQYREGKRKELGFNDDDVILISMGDLIVRKNYKVAIKAISKCNNTKLYYLICGKGEELANLKKLAVKLNVENQIHFLGFRSDIKELLSAADLFIFTTLQEGMPRSLMEAMASELPCVVSEIRGNTDLIENGVNGYLCSATDHDSFSSVIGKLADNSVLRRKMGMNNLEKIRDYDISVVEEEMKKIYGEILE